MPGPGRWKETPRTIVARRHLKRGAKECLSYRLKNKGVYCTKGLQIGVGETERLLA